MPSAWLKQLANVEISTGFLWVAGLTFIFVFTLLLREIVAWLVKQNETKEEIETLRNTVESLRVQVEKLTVDLNRQSVRVETHTSFPLNEETLNDQTLIN